MRIFEKTLIVSLCVLLSAQEETKTKKRKVYRTQSGSIIEAPKPLFKRTNTKPDSKSSKTTSKNATALARTKKVESSYRNELDSLKSKVQLLLKQSSQLQKNYDEKLSEQAEKPNRYK